MFIDTHHHLWRYNEKEYGWMDGSMSVLKRDYLPRELNTEMEKSGVTGTIAVQARQKIEETGWLLEMAGDHSFIKGVVGWVDLRSTDVEVQINALADHPKLVGIRHVIHDEPDDDFMLRQDFIRGIWMLRTYHLVYELLLFPRHLERAVQLVRRNPYQRFVLDHIGKPAIRSGVLAPWRDDIERLGAEPNVWCKISGMVTEADHSTWEYSDFVPYMEVVLEAFGPDRLMVGSDWPVCRLAGEYDEVMAIPLQFIQILSDSEREKLLYRNAMECYQIEI
jgi:L-fuconolactonase